MSVKQLGRKSNWIVKPVSLEAHEKPFQAKTHEEQSKDPAAIIQKVWRGRPQLRRDTRAPPAQPVSRGGRVQLTRLQTSGTNNRESSQTWEDTYRPRTSTFMRNAQHILTTRRRGVSAEIWNGTDELPYPHCEPRNEANSNDERVFVDWESYSE